MVGLSYRYLLIALFLIISIVGHASASGRSVDDMVGAFSIEKTIKLGSSSACFGNADGTGTAGDQKDPLGMAINALADSQPPDLAGFGFEPKVLADEPRSISFTAHITEDESGLASAKAFFRSPSGKQIAEIIFTPEFRVSGTSRDGIYTNQMILPKGSESGAWLLDNIALLDASGNSKVLSRSDLVGMNLPAEFLVS